MTALRLIALGALAYATLVLCMAAFWLTTTALLGSVLP